MDFKAGVRGERRRASGDCSPFNGACQDPVTRILIPSAQMGEGSNRLGVVVFLPELPLHCLYLGIAMLLLQALVGSPRIGVFPSNDAAASRSETFLAQPPRATIVAASRRRRPT